MEKVKESKNEVSLLDKAKVKLRNVQKLLNSKPKDKDRTFLLQKQTKLQNEIIKLSKQ